MVLWSRGNVQRRWLAEAAFLCCCSLSPITRCDGTLLARGKGGGGAGAPPLAQLGRRKLGGRLTRASQSARAHDMSSGLLRPKSPMC